MSRSRPTTIWTLSRASGVDMNPTMVAQRANQFASATAGFDATTLLLTRDADGIHGRLITVGTGGDTKTAATNLAHAVGARADEAEFPEGLVDENIVGWLVYESGSSVAREVQVGVDPTETARLLANSLPHDSWVAITLRRPTKSERKRNVAWLSHRLSTAVPTHHSMSPDSVVVSIFAGGPDSPSVRHLLDATRSAMPGFDVATRSKVATRASAGIPAWVSGALLAAAAVGSKFAAPLPDLMVPGLGAAAALLLLGTLRFLGVLPSAWKRTQEMATTGVFTAPRKKHTRTTPPRKAVTSGDKQRDARDGDYPLHKTSFMVGPQVVIGVVSPQAGAVSGESSTKARQVPPAMLRRIGPLIGDSDDGPAYLSAEDTKFGVAILGAPGSGKTQLMRSLFAWSCLDRTRPSHLPGFPGTRNALVAFESKGDGVPAYQAWANATGDKMVVIDIADPASFALDMFAVPGTPAERASFFTNAMQYAFTDGSIQDRSFETLVSVLTAALTLTPQVAGRAEGVDPNGSPIYFAHILLGGRGDNVGVALASEITHASMQPGATLDMKEAVVAIAPLYQGKTESARRTLTEAPRNKVGQLLALESWWSPARRKVTWEMVLGNHRALVINTGTSATGRVVDAKLGQQMSSMLMFSLQNAIQRICSGWLDEHRSLSIFSDELSLLAGNSPEVITWLRDQGRSFGVRPYLATQRPEQLPDRVRTAMLTFATLVSYRQDDVKTANEVAVQVSGTDGEWTASDVLHLEPYTAIVRAGVAQRRQSAFTVKVRNFEGDRVGFAAEQGYDAAPSAFLPPQMPLTSGVQPVTAEVYTQQDGPVAPRAASVAAAAVARVRQSAHGTSTQQSPAQPGQPVDPAAQAAPIAPVPVVDPADAPVLADPVPQRVFVEDETPEDPTPNLMNW